MHTTTFHVEGPLDDEALRLLTNAIQDLPCLGDVEVDAATGTVSIEHTSMLAEGDIYQAIEAAGFVIR